MSTTRETPKVEPTNGTSIIPLSTPAPSAVQQFKPETSPEETLTAISNAVTQPFQARQQRRDAAIIAERQVVAAKRQLRTALPSEKPQLRQEIASAQKAYSQAKEAFDSGDVRLVFSVLKTASDILSPIPIVGSLAALIVNRLKKDTAVISGRDTSGKKLNAIESIAALIGTSLKEGVLAVDIGLQASTAGTSNVSKLGGAYKAAKEGLDMVVAARTLQQAQKAFEHHDDQAGIKATRGGFQAAEVAFHKSGNQTLAIASGIFAEITKLVSEALYPQPRPQTT